MKKPLYWGYDTSVLSNGGVIVQLSSRLTEIIFTTLRNEQNMWMETAICIWRVKRPKELKLETRIIQPYKIPQNEKSTATGTATENY